MASPTIFYGHCSITTRCQSYVFRFAWCVTLHALRAGRSWRSGRLRCTQGKHANHFDHDLWEAYKAANKAFCDVVRCHQLVWLAHCGVVHADVQVCMRTLFARVGARQVVDSYQKGDLVWVQDYHLMVLPAFLRAKLHKARIGWFLHTPFPSSEVYRMLPVREEVCAVLGMGGCACVGINSTVCVWLCVASDPSLCIDGGCGWFSYLRLRA